jgi:hypothetical protein
LYAAVSYLFGSTELHRTPSSVFLSTNDGNEWELLSDDMNATVAELIPLGGRKGAAYALTTTSRTPVALGSAPLSATPPAITHEYGNLILHSDGFLSWLGWVVAGGAILALAFAIAVDLGFLRHRTARGRLSLLTQKVRADR